MIIYDLIHGYQPFMPQIAIPKWVKRNLKNFFLPTSLAMRKGIIQRGVQLQGWTIKSWLASKNNSKIISQLAKKTLNNLKIATRKRYIEVGTSAYSHPILPMLSDDLIRAQIILDRKIVEKYIGKPTWFWPPEGAISQKVLKIVHEIYPDLILLIPDKSIPLEAGRLLTGQGGPIKINFSTKNKPDIQKAIVFSTFLKDLFMNAEDYRHKPKYVNRPKHLPKDLIWARVRRLVHSPRIFLEVLKYLSKDNLNSQSSFVLMRDWENAGSKKGLRNYKIGADKVKEIGDFLKLKNQIDFRLPTQFNWKKANIFPISKIISASWDIDSNPQDPFPWWVPNKYGKIWRHRKPFRRKRIIEWQQLVKEYDQFFQQKIKILGGFKKALNNKKFENLLEETLPVVHSCVGWHYLAKRAWKPDYQYSQNAIKEIVLPGIERLKEFSI